MFTDEAALQHWYGPADGLPPTAVAEVFEGSDLCWAIAGGRAARIGAELRRHADTDIEIPLTQLAAVRAHLEHDWHLWQALDGALKPLPPGAEPEPGLHQLWLRRDSGSPWQLEIMLRPGDEQEWACRRDPEIRLPIAAAHVPVDGVPHLRPEIALLFKAKNDRAKDRADLAAAVLEESARSWLVHHLEQLGYDEWAAAVPPARG